jgi:glucan biosynthesis protein C
MSDLTVQKPSTDFTPAQAQASGRDLAIDYLRPFVIILVVFLHAALAYASFSVFNYDRYVASTAPVVNASRWPLLDPLVLFFDTFMMALLFLVSGLFTTSSLERKGSGGFFIARLLRLGVPFVVGALFLAPLAFWPGYLLAAPASPTPYLARFFTSDGWQVGAPWFLWILLVFDGIAALTYRLAPGVLAKLRRPPSALVIFLAAIMAFLPLNLFISAYDWVSMGPFDMQPARLGLYFAYFLLGIALGTGQEWRKVGWPRHWEYWLALGILSFSAYMWFQGNGAPNLAVQVMRSVAFASSCAGTSLGLLGAFRQFARQRHPAFDSLSANAFGIYLLHYPLVHWIQFALLSAPWPAWAKFGIAFIGGLALSWGASWLVRKIPAVRRFL